MSNETDYAPDETDTAFTQSDNNSLGDLPLEPFTSERFVCAQGMGLRWPGIPDDSRSDVLYKGQVNDAVIVLWLCSIPSRLPALNSQPSTLNSPPSPPWDIRRALRQPEKAHEAAMDWAEEQRITAPDSSEFWKAIAVFNKILSEIIASYATPAGARAAPSPSTGDPAVPK